jgi:hypothetical protein
MVIETEQAVELAPARVRAIAGDRLKVRWLEGEQDLWARSALALAYTPQVGDTVLVIGGGGAHYVIGVLEGTGTATLTVPADLELRAPRGSIQLVSGRGVRIAAPRIGLHSHRLDVIAQVLRERLVNAQRWVREAVHIRAGRIKTVAAGNYDLKAERVRERATKDVHIDGTKIHLG